MKVSEFIVNRLCQYGVTDVFGIPGGVILRFLYAVNDREPDISTHLTYHEQTAAFAALGYAQASGNLGVAYATRGPGICNMFTAIAEAYQESIPVLFITAHGNRDENKNVRFLHNQELNIVESVRNITKFAADIDDLSAVIPTFNKACHEALMGRRGPVLIDISAKLWNLTIESSDTCGQDAPMQNTDCEVVFTVIKEEINQSKRPAILIGDGLRHTSDKEVLIHLAEQLRIPVLSSRGSQDLLSGSSYYYGYVGSHGVRYSNFILSKTDLIISIGNRMAFPLQSDSFKPIVENAHVIRLDIDEGEFIRRIPGERTIHADIRSVIEEICQRTIEIKSFEEWNCVCRDIKDELENEDCDEPVISISNFIKEQPDDCIYVCDVGNNEFWFSRAYEKSGSTSCVLQSKSFGTLGSAIGKAIGAYYDTRKNIVCVVGDQGFQYNIQELQYIKKHKLPVKILLINNKSSGMIADHEKSIYGERLIHTTDKTGYGSPNFNEIVRAYHVENCLYEINVERSIRLTPTLPKGNSCQEMEPAIEDAKIKRLCNL